MPPLIDRKGLSTTEPSEQFSNSGPPKRFSALIQRLAFEWPFFIAFALVCGLIFQFGMHDWWLPADEGLYAHSAQRLLEGELPHRDFIALHPGTVLWLNALALKLAGIELSSLRFPSALANLAQSLILYGLLRPWGRGLASLCVVWVGAMGLPAITSPSASVLCTFFLLAALLVAGRPRCWRSPVDMTLIGWLLGQAFCCRQLGAAYLGAALLTWVLSHQDVQAKDRESSLLGRLFLAFTMLFVLLYLWGRSDLFGVVAFGLGPLLMTWQALWRGRPPTALVLKLVAYVGFGFALAFVPFILAYGYLGVLGAWFSDVFIGALGSLDTGFEGGYRYSTLFVELTGTIFLIRSPLQFLQLATWTSLLFLSLMISFAVLRQRHQGKESAPFIFCAPFIAMTALHMEIEIYLLWALPAAVAAGLALLGARRWWIATVLLVGFLNSAVGRPVWLGEQSDLVLTEWGGRRPLVRYGGAADLNLPYQSAEFYRRSVELIHEHVEKDESIFSFPYHAEWYFLSQRKNPTRYVPGLSIRTEEQFQELSDSVRRASPKMIVFGKNDKYNTAYTQRLRTLLESDYQVLRVDGGYEFLLRRSEPIGATGNS